MTEPLLSVENLSVGFVQGDKQVQAVIDVSFQMGEAARVGIIGESGSGKTVTALSILRLHDSRHVVYGAESRINYRGEDILTMPKKRLQTLRGGEIGMIFQNPMTSLNPTFTIGSQIEHVIRLHHGLTSDESRQRTIAALQEVELPNPESQVNRYPNELSGGQRQRALIAMVLACEPKLIIADEPTSALDVTVQASILEMLLKRTSERGISVLMITHDMGVVSRFCQDINVMYGGMVAESGRVKELFRRPEHPYTSGLLRSIPSLVSDRSERLYSIPGRQEQRLAITRACPFSSRCDYSVAACEESLPPMSPVGEPGHFTSCIRHAELDLSGAS